MLLPFEPLKKSVVIPERGIGLKEFMRRRHLVPRQVRDMTGVSLPTIRAHMERTSKAQWHTVHRLAEGLNCNPLVLFDPEDMFATTSDACRQNGPSWTKTSRREVLCEHCNLVLQPNGNCPSGTH